MIQCSCSNHETTSSLEESPINWREFGMCCKRWRNAWACKASCPSWTWARPPWWCRHRPRRWWLSARWRTWGAGSRPWGLEAPPSCGHTDHTAWTHMYSFSITRSTPNLVKIVPVMWSAMLGWTLSDVRNSWGKQSRGDWEYRDRRVVLLSCHYSTTMTTSSWLIKT